MSAMNRSATIIVLFVLIVAGCSPERPSLQASKQRLRRVGGLPAEMTVKQRSTIIVPNSQESLRLTIDDITRGQVMASLSDQKGGTVLATTSLKRGESAAFTLEADTYYLTLTELNNALVGEDFATFVISTKPAKGAISERDKIERLLAVVESAEGIVFIRNDVEHDAKEAAAHLRKKLQAAGSRIATAEQFIDEIGTKSSLTGEPYRVRLPDGKEMSTGDYLRAKLREIEVAAR
jgi:hypothetical protein